MPADVYSLLFSGNLLLKNWKPIPLREITSEGEEATVAEILGQIASLPTLKIEVERYPITVEEPEQGGSKKGRKWWQISKLTLSC